MHKFSHRILGATAFAAFAAVLFFAAANNAFAAVTVTAATGGSAVSADTNTTNGTATWTTLTGPTVTETTGRAISTGSGTIVLTAPSGFSYNTGVTVTATITRNSGAGTCFTFSSNTATPTASSITYTITARDSNGSTDCHVTFSNIQVRPTAGTPLATGNITNTGSNAQVPSGAGNNYGTLTEVAAAKNKLIYTTQPATTATTSVAFTTDPVIKLEDQYGNTEISDSASTVSLAVVLSTQACGGTAGSGTLTSTPASGAAVTAGVMTYTAMQYSAAESIKICASSSGVTSALSNAITVNSPPAPTLTSISPTTTIAGTTAFTLTANGANYSASSTINWNGSPNATSFVSASQATTTVSTAEIASAGTDSVTVSTPGAGTSSAQTFTVSAMPSSLIVFKSATSTSLNGTATTITVNKPAGVVQGDTEVAFISYRPNTETLTAPTGWVLENNQQNTFDDADGMAVYVLLAGASEPTSYTWTLSSGSTGSAGAIEDFSGVSPTTPVNAVSSTAPLNNSYVQIAPSVTTNVAGAMVLAGYSDANADSWSGVFSMIQDVDAASAAVPNAVGESLAIDRVVQASAGATGAFTNIVSSQSDASDAGQAVTLALQPGHADPTTTSISPTSTTAGSAQFTLTVNGTGFDSSSVVDFNGSPLATTFVSYTQVTAIVPAADVTVGGTASITVVNPTPGGGTSNAQTFTINNPVPTTTSISPTSTTAGGSSFTLTVTGANYNASSTIDFNGVALTTTFISSTTISVTVPAVDIAVGGTDSITVVNPAPGGGTSGAQTLTVKNPVPTTTSISPTSTTAGGNSFTLTVTGTNFNASSTVDFNGSGRTTIFVSSTTLTTTILASDITFGGTASITVVNPTPGGGTSNAQTLTINNPVPTTSSISPTSTTAGGSNFTLTVTGTNFNVSSTIDFNGTPFVTTFVSSTTITITVPAVDIAVGGTDSITVVNPAPGGGTSGAQTLTVKNPVPTTTSISPTSTTAGGNSFTLTVTGTNFNASSTVDFNGSSRATTFVSTTTLTATITAGDIATAGTASITVVNPTPGGGTSNAQTLTIKNPVPTTTSISPTSTTAGGNSFTLTVTGTNFTASSTIDFNGVALVTTFISSSSITATIPAVDIATAGTASITVVNGIPGGGTSNAQTLTIANPIPTLTSISPTSTTAGSSGFTLTLTGTNFIASSSVQWNGSARVTTFVSSTTLQAAILTSDLTTPTTSAVTVVNPTPGGGTSGAQTFTVTKTATSITVFSSATSSVYGNSVTFTATVTPSAGGPPSGTVTFKDGAATLGTGTLNGANPGVATFSTSTLSVAGSPHSITAVYGGDSSFSASTSSAISQVITTKTLTVTGITASNKTYDGTTAATLVGTPGTLVGVVGGDSVSLAGTAVGTFATSSVGNNITVTVSGQSLTGAQASNYSLTEPTTTANITQKALTVSGMTASNKTYDASTTATLNTGSAALVGVIAGDTVTLNTGSAVGTFATSSVGSNITVTISGLTISGAQSSNYSLTEPTTTANINQKNLTVTGITANDKTYDGTTAATLNTGGATLAGVIAGDTVTLNTASAVGAFATSSAGSNITVTISGLTISGAQSSNYSLTEPTTTANILNPVPTTTSISPTSTTAGSSGFTLTVTGTNFVSGSTVNFNGSARSTTFVSTTTLTATILASDVLTAGSYPVTVTNAAPGGGTSNAQTFTVIAAQNPAPILTALSPTSTIAGSGGFTLALTGTGFISSSTVDWNGSSRATTFVSSTTIEATILDSDVATAGTESVTVVNPTPGGGTSGSQTFTVLNPVPTTTSLSPTSTAAGSSNFTLTVSGTNFVASSTVDWNGSPRTTTFASSTEVTATILASDVVATGTASVTVVNATPGGGTSNAQTFTITAAANPAPTVVSISPTSTFAGSSNFTLTVTGTNFIGSSVVEWNGLSRTTTVVSSTEVTATILASDVAATGTAMITVFNPAPGGGTSTAQTFTVNPAPPGAAKFIFANVTSSAVTAGSGTMFNIEAVTASGTVDTSFQQGVTLTVSGSGTGGGLVTIVDGVGTTTVNDDVAQTVTLGLQDSQVTGLDVSATANVIFVAGPVAQFTLNHPGNMNADTRLGYTLGREDQFGNPVSASTTVAYLYTNSTSSNAAFFNAATGGTAITSTAISSGSTSTPFWYYDDTSGSRTVTASDNPVAPDGATGIIDASDTFSVAPGAVKFIFANVPASATAGNSATVNVYAVDSSNNIYPSFAGGVTITTSGSASGGGLVTLVNGVGTTTITDATAETVALGFRDTQNTGLGITATSQIVFNAAAVTPTTGGSAPTQIPTSGIKPTTVLTFSGMAYPGATVSVISKALGLAAAPVTQAVPVAADGSFLISLNGIVRLTGQTYLLSFVDRNGLIAQTKAYNIPTQDKVVYGNILAAPTLGFENASVISRGTPLIVTGYATPKATVELFVDGNPAGTVLVNDPTGKYTYPLDTDALSFGRHSVWALQKNGQDTVEVSGYENSISENELFLDDATEGTLLAKNASGTYVTFVPAVNDGTTIVRPVTVSLPYVKQAESDFSNQESFTVSPLADPMLDLNGDGVVDIKDLSIFLSYLKSLSVDVANFHITDPNIVKVLDFDHDGVVDANDLQILITAIEHP